MGHMMSMMISFIIYCRQGGGYVGEHIKYRSHILTEGY